MSSIFTLFDDSFCFCLKLCARKYRHSLLIFRGKERVTREGFIGEDGLPYSIVLVESLLQVLPTKHSGPSNKGSTIISGLVAWGLKISTTLVLPY